MNLYLCSLYRLSFGIHDFNGDGISFLLDFLEFFLILGGNMFFFDDFKLWILPRERWLWIAILSLVAACAPTPDLAPPTTLAPTALLSPTASPAPTRLPSPEPIDTAEPQDSLFHDDFSADLGWQLAQGSTGAISLLDQRLVISVRGPGATLYTLSPAPEQSDLTVEVDVRSEICDAGDEFGLMVRARSLEVHYRFTLSCDGMVRASRFVDGGEAALAPITPTDAAISGAPAVNHLSLEAVGNRMRFAVNRIQVLEVTDSRIPTGGVGLIVRARRGSQTTISFDNFSLWAVGGE